MLHTIIKETQKFETSLLLFCTVPGISSNTLNKQISPGRIAQSVMCLATDASLTSDPGVASSIPARSHTVVEIDNEIISTGILFPSA